MTTTATDILRTLGLVRNHAGGAVTMIDAAPGMGKTEPLLHYKQGAKNTFIMTCVAGEASPLSPTFGLMRSLDLGEPNNCRMPAERLRIAEAISPDGMLILEESQNLAHAYPRGGANCDSFEWMRALAEDGCFSLVFSGELKLVDATFRTRLAETMGLGPDATPEQMLSLVTRMMSMMAKATGKPDTEKVTMAELMTAITTPDPAQFVPVAAVQAMLTERNATLATMTDARAAEKVKDATRKGYLSPAMAEWATALCMSNEVSFDAFIAKSVPQFAHLSHELTDLNRLPPGVSAGDRAGSEVADAICAQLGLAPGALKD